MASSCGSWRRNDLQLQFGTDQDPKRQNYSGVDTRGPSLWQGESQVLHSEQGRRSVSPTGGAYGRSANWAPSRRELKKYATLFLRHDSNRDGIVEAHDAQLLCRRSGLGDEILGKCWELADRDQDGRLSFHEFIALVHCVSCCLRGLELPHALPPALAEAIARVHETPEELHAQRSPSASSRSSVTSRSSAVSSTVMAPAATAPHPNGRNSLESTVARGPLARDVSVETSASSLADGSDTTGSCSSPRFGHEKPRQPPPPLARAQLTAEQVAAVRRQLTVVKDADRRLSAHVRQEVDSLLTDTEDVRGAHAQLETEVVRRREEAKRLAALQWRLEREVADANDRFVELCSIRRDLGSQLLSPEALRRRFSEELDFLQQAVEEETRLIDEIGRINAAVEQSCKGLQFSMTDLERQRQEIVAQSGIEVDLMQKERGELKVSATRTRQEKADAPSWKTPCSALYDFTSPPLANAPETLRPCGWASSLLAPATALPSGTGGWASSLMVAAPRRDSAASEASFLTPAIATIASATNPRFARPHDIGPNREGV